ncbi:dihydrofolate reductase [Microcoleus sp. C2C3]|uniref:dihydrofolate reductase n=1 Tax=unclassified Microcoleus TaxID=2642155 RepID=UPI002FCEEAB4
MEKVIIAAKAANNVIGKDNSLPWHLPADQEFFRRTIKGNFLIAGRKFFESIQGREVFHEGVEGIVISRQKDYKSPTVRVAQSIEESFQLAEQKKVQRIYILGGGEIYQQTIALADRLIITEIHANFEGDTFFPDIDKSRWQEVSRSDRKKYAVNPYDYSFVVYEPLS